MPSNEANDKTEEEQRRTRRVVRRTVSLASISSRVAKLESSHRPSFIFDHDHDHDHEHQKASSQCSSRKQSSKNAGEETQEEPILISTIIGNFGWFQLLVLIFSGLRDFTDSYDALMMSMVFRPETDFYCLDAGNNRTLDQLGSGRIGENGGQCFRSLANGSMELDADGKPVACKSWQFIRGFDDDDDDDEASLVVEWALVCDRHWLVAPIQSCFFFGLVVGNLTWGYLADKFGRRRIYLIGHVIQVLFGVASIFLTNVGLYAACRFLTAFGSASHNILYSVQVEMIGAKYRPYCTALNHFGWGAGIISTPFIARASADYRYVIGVSPITTLIMLPFAFMLPESSRWLEMNGRPEEAQRELLRVAKFNKIPLTDSLVDKVRQLSDRQVAERKTNCIEKNQQSTYSTIIRDPVLLRDTLVLCYSIFLGYLFYYVLTLNFAYIENLSIEANFITSGAGEWLSVLLGALMLRYLTRRASLCLILNIMAASFLFQYLIDSDSFPLLDTRPIITLNNAIGTASTLLLVFVLLIVNQEVYPTIVRQTGSSFVNTVAEIGATMAPIAIQVSRVYGLWRADIVSAVVCFIGAVFVLFLTETGNKELL